MKIRDNKTGKIFEYGSDPHHALRISENGGCLLFENLQNGDGSLEDGNGGYSFVLDDDKTPEESDSADAINGCSYANIGGFNNLPEKQHDFINVPDSSDGKEPKGKNETYLERVYKKYKQMRWNDRT